ncbi:4Fe-4S binding protein [Algihabitans albus]|uniref:4Fe-4S binding protein n=1 Tax=Algihabitans albus TaxID=2164067 RepID=UPI000E5D5C1E|nr:4Fe-4S binding protein [Algihabitans albus]
MRLGAKRLLVCDCESTMPLDSDKLTKACKALGGEGELQLNTQLCRNQLGNFQQAVLGQEPLLIACTQEAPLFDEVAAEDNPQAQLGFLNIRETAGWSEEAGAATPKIAALLAEAALDLQPAPTVSFASEGTCLVYGRDSQALEAAQQLKTKLDVTVLLMPEADSVMPPRVMDLPVFRGRITSAQGHLGAFAINVDGYAAAKPSSRLELAFEAPRDNAYSECDLILDLTGEAPLFTGHERRDGYLRPDPGNPAAVQKAIFEISELTGEFEKPRYVKYDANICAHSRSRKTGCTRCLDVCPTGAITPAGDQVEIDPHICGGCGMCASVCPTGAATYQLPAGNSLFERLRSLLEAYHKAGGTNATLLLHDGRHGEEMISLMARGGRGLPPQVIPFPLNEVTLVGVDFFAMAFAYGATRIALLIGPDKRGELEGLAGQIALAETVMDGLGYGGGRIDLLDEADPDKVEARLWELESRSQPEPGGFLPMGGKRTRSMLALRHLHGKAPQTDHGGPPDLLPLPKGAPFGRVKVDTDGCTMCLACVSACPTGALQDDPDRPWLGFSEEACVQCGLCANTCPESVITLEPRLNFSEEARAAVKLNETEPFNCIRCGKPFGVKHTIDRITDQLAGKHWMFGSSDTVERIMMCDDCRVVVHFEQPNPMAGPERPAIRTTDDYFREREIEEARAKVRAERDQEGDDSV